MELGESINVEFKRHLELANEKEKSEFVRGSLALTNSQLRGGRYLVIGFADDGEFVGVSAKVDQERLEQILHAWCNSGPDVTVTNVEWSGGIASLVEFTRAEAKLPYVAVKSLSRLVAGTVYVRHGRHTTPASKEEEADIRQEGDRMRQEQAERVRQPS